ncbi:MAG: ATP-dependent DNA helicase UvrD2 [Actinomycetaceae bacterium]|nr:ATP-dependent DNA helicase UvrD2 [Actinomycetaceae bacterium]MDY5272978.1 ATP-dependent DNA helicase UvrD2 [Arcanobacterium sp.]
MDDELLTALDPDQRAVAEAVRGFVCVRAGAGTGKTRAITYRIAHAVRTGAVRPQNVLAVTFTARAAGEMRSRLRDLGVRGVQARTFHSAALSQLRYFWPNAIGGRVPEIKESKAAFVAAAAAQQGIPTDLSAVRDLAAEIEWAKVSLVTAEDYPVRARQAGRIDVAGQSPEDIAQLINTYEDIKAERGVIDFEDVILILIGMMIDRPDIARNIRDQYSYFVVDEYQDVSPMQQRLLQLWLGDRRDLCVVGDSAQTIYSFTGARSEYLENFTKIHPRSREIILARNYRSTPEIIALANAVLASGSGVQPVQLRAMSDSGKEVGFASYAHGSQEAEKIAAAIKALAAQGEKLSNIAILYRTNAQSAEFERALDDAGIAFVLQGQESFFKRREVREAMVVLRAQAREESPSRSGGLSGGDGNGSLNGGVASGQFDSAPLPEIVEAALRNMGWRPQGPTARGASRERWESLDALRVLAEELWEKRHAGIRQFVAELEERAQLHNVPLTNAVTLSSLHGAKGLEWDVVFLAGLAEGLIPISYAQTPQAIAEERRLLYVGITRARTQLYLSYARSYGTRSQSKPSRFLSDLWPREDSRATQTRRRSAADKRQFQDESPEVLALFERLRQWRAQVADDIGKPAYVIFHDATLRMIARVHPQTLVQLGEIRGVGKTKLSAYGEDVLDIVRSS